MSGTESLTPAQIAAWEARDPATRPSLMSMRGMQQAPKPMRDLTYFSVWVGVALCVLLGIFALILIGAARTDNGTPAFREEWAEGK